MKLYDLLDRELLAEMYAEGYVNLQVHPTQPLGILNYSKTAAWDRMWNPVTLSCRGLIYNMVTEDIVARPFDKFFNYQEFMLPLDMTSEVEVTDKADGSLGILYQEPFTSRWAIATRGSFASDQARHATEVYREKYEGKWTPIRGLTYLFEIVYPDNRIVLNYGKTDDLVYLGCVDIDTGKSGGPVDSEMVRYLFPDMAWPGPRTDVLPATTLAEALALKPRPNAEGVVVRYKDSGIMVKVKQEDYIALHRIVTGMNDRVVWERLGAGETVADIQRDLPEEFWPWVQEVADRLCNQVDETIVSVWKEFMRVLDSMPEDFTRRDFALAVKDHAHRGYLFKYLDNQTIYDAVWKTVKPAPTRTLVEDDDA